MSKTIEDFFYYFVYISDAVVILLLLLFFKFTSLRLSYWILAAYCLINTTVNVFNHQYIHLDILSNAIFTFFEYSLFSLLFYEQLKSPFFKKFILYAIIPFLLFQIFYFLNIKPQTLDSLPIAIETILILVYTFCYLYEQSNGLEKSFIYERWHFWIATGVLIYLAGSFFIYVFADYVDITLIEDYWFLTYGFYILKNILFIIAIFIYVHELKTNQTPRNSALI